MPVRPLPGEQPAKGFSWEDYEGVQVSEDASDEEEGGWGVVRSRRSRFHSSLMIFKACLNSIRRTEQDRGFLGRRNSSHVHGRVAVTAADEKTAPERAETRGVEGNETREGVATASGFHGAQARTRARSCGRTGRCSKAYRISLRHAGLTAGKTQNRLDDKEVGFYSKNYIIHPLLYVSYRLSLWPAHLHHGHS